MKRLLILAAALSLAGCSTPPGTARESVEAMGLHDIQVGGIDLLGCGKDDFVGRNFTAKNSEGRTVKGVVCTGMFKGATVRFTGFGQ